MADVLYIAGVHLRHNYCACILSPGGRKTYIGVDRCATSGIIHERAERLGVRLQALFLWLL